MSGIASKKIMDVLTHLWQCGLFSISRAAEPLWELRGLSVSSLKIIKKRKEKNCLLTEKMKTEKHIFEG